MEVKYNIENMKLEGSPQRYEVNRMRRMRSRLTQVALVIVLVSVIIGTAKA
jgi:hypothetical protein